MNFRKFATGLKLPTIGKKMFTVSSLLKLIAPRPRFMKVLMKQPMAKPFAAFGVVALLPPLTVSAWGPSFGKKKMDTKGIKIRKEEDSVLVTDVLDCDDMYATGEMNRNDEVYDRLNRHRDKEEPELLWRLARSTYEKAKKIKDTAGKIIAIEEAFALVKQALALDDQSFGAHKWTAILLNELSQLKGTKEQITQSFVVKHHMERAAALNPQDPTSFYLLGQWCFSVAEVPWYQQKIASAIFATPPTSTYDEALEHFLRAENLQPLFYSMNLLMLGKTYLKLGNTDKAREYLQKLETFPLRTEDDFVAKKDGKQILDTLPAKKETNIAIPQLLEAK